MAVASVYLRLGRWIRVCGSEDLTKTGEVGGKYKTSDEVTNAWNEIALEMLAEGFVVKDPKLLIRKWRDLKYRVRKKARSIRSNTEGGEKEDICLNPLEERVLNLAGRSGSATKRKPPYSVFTFERKVPSTPPVVNQRISQCQETPSTTTKPLMPKVSPEALNHYTEKVPSTEETAMYQTASEASMDISYSENVDYKEISVPRISSVYEIPRGRTFKKRKRLQAKSNFDKIMDVEIRKLTLEETKIELHRKKIEIEENIAEALKEQAQLTKENLAIAKQQLIMSSEILTVLRDAFLHNSCSSNDD